MNKLFLVLLCGVVSCGPVGCDEEAPSYDMGAPYALTESLAEERSKASERARQVFEEIELSGSEPFAVYDFASGKKQERCSVQLSFEEAVFPLGRFEFDCEQVMDKREALMQAESWIRGRLLPDDVGGVSSEVLMPAMEWAADAAAVSTSEQRWGTGFDMKKCAKTRLELMSTAMQKRAAEQCSIYKKPMERLQAYKAGLLRETFDKERAVALVDEERPAPELDDATWARVKAEDAGVLVIPGLQEVSVVYDGSKAYSFLLRAGERVELRLKDATGRVKAALYSDGRKYPVDSESVSEGKEGAMGVTAAEAGSYLVVFTGIDKRSDGGSLTLVADIERHAGGLSDEQLADYKALLQWLDGLEPQGDELRRYWQRNVAEELGFACVEASLLDDKNVVAGLLRMDALRDCLGYARRQLRDAKAHALLQSAGDYSGEAVKEILDAGE